MPCGARPDGPGPTSRRCRRAGRGTASSTPAPACYVHLNNLAGGPVRVHVLGILHGHAHRYPVTPSSSFFVGLRGRHAGNRVFTHTLSTDGDLMEVGFTRARQAIENCAPPGTSPSKQISDRQKFFRSSGTDISFPNGGSRLHDVRK